MILDDIIAAHEMMVGRYYQKNKSYLAAIGRYSFVVAQFPYTEYAKEALYRTMECCLSLGLSQEAENDNKLQAFDSRGLCRNTETMFLYL